jgi:hypothetical protein
LPCSIPTILELISTKLGGYKVTKSQLLHS